LPESAPASFRHSGKYASGALGERTWQQVRAEAQDYLDLARSLPPFAGGPPQPVAQAIDLPIGGRLVGSIGSLFADGDACWLVSISTSQPSFKQLIPLFIDWASLNLARPEASCKLVMIHKNDDKKPALGPPIPFTADREQLRSGLAALVALYRNAYRTAGVYYARTSYGYAEVLHEKPEDAEAAAKAARTCWNGSDFNGGSLGERDYAPMYNRMLAGDERFIETDTPEHERFAGVAQSLLAIITGRPQSGEAA
jgi:exonuclease V gamma subunit